MDLTILHAIWFDCPDLPDTAHKLLLALAYHGSPCWPSVERLANHDPALRTPDAISASSA